MQPALQQREHGTTGRAPPALAGPCITCRVLGLAWLPFVTSAVWELEGREGHKQAPQRWGRGGYILWVTSDISGWKIDYRENLHILQLCWVVWNSRKEAARSPEQEGPDDKVFLQHLKNKFPWIHCKMLTLWQEKHSQKYGHRCKKPRPAVKAELALETKSQGSRQGLGGCSLIRLQLLQCSLLLDPIVEHTD